MEQNDTIDVTHVLRQASDNSLLMLDTRPLRKKRKGRLIFQNSWIKEQAIDDLVKEACSKFVNRLRMFQVTHKLKGCKHKFIQWRNE